MRLDTTKFIGIGLLLTLLVAAGGCGSGGPAIAPVSGRVTLDSQPVNEAQVVFQPEAGGAPSTGFTDRDGKYELGYKRGRMGALIGRHSVRIRMDTEVLDDGGKLVQRPQAIPPRYNSDTELKREVKAGEDNVFDFDLKSDGK
jgi:hypothetical protein